MKPSLLVDFYRQVEIFTRPEMIDLFSLKRVNKSPAVGFGVFEALAILGKYRCVARIERARTYMSESQQG